MTCKSCLSEIIENNRFCANCGAKIVHERISLKGTWEEFIGPFFSWDNNFWKTFIQLFTNPKEVLEAYVNGARKKYFNPFSYLILFATLAVFFYKFFPMGDVMDFSDGFTKGVSTTNTSAKVPNFDTKHFIENMMNYYNFYYIIMIPLLALVSYLTFLKQKNNFPEHLVYNAYLQTNLGYISLFLQVLFLNIIGFSFNQFYITYLIIAILFSIYAFKKLYALSFKQVLISIIKFWTILFVLCLILFVIGSILVITYVVLSK